MPWSLSDFLDPCRWRLYRYVRTKAQPSLSTWLTRHPNVANAIQWQHLPASTSNAYAAPTQSHKIAWPNWAPARQTDLINAYRDACVWFECGAYPKSIDPNGLTDRPVNVNPNVNLDTVTAIQSVTPAYMWKLYIAHVGFTLAAQRKGRLPWSILTYSDEALRYLLDSTTMAWNIFGTYYGMGTYSAYVPAKREANLPKTAFAPPMWTYPWLKQAGLIGATRLDTIGNVLQWMRQNMVHFYGTDTFANFNAIWQYRGYPPLSKIVNGTVDANNPGMGVRHWTAGCHGSVGFLSAVLRAVNIPVQPVWVCGHELAYFVTEHLYLDHGDDPYNQNVKNSGSPVLSLLIDEGTYELWFTTDLTANITGAAGPGCANVGRRAAEFV
jgi:hypothetical protein